jgi:hypothetical protein
VTGPVRLANGAVQVSVQGVCLALRASGALWLAAPQTLVVADLHLEKGSASTLAEALERMIPQMRANPVQMINPLGGESKPKAPASFFGCKSWLKNVGYIFFTDAFSCIHHINFNFCFFITQSCF